MQPDLITFSADPAQDVLSTSYHGIKLFSSTRLTTVLPITSDTGFGPAYWVSGINNATSQYILKAAIYNATSAVQFNVEFGQTSTTANLTVLTAPDPYSTFTFNGTNPVIETVSTLVAVDGVFSFELQNYAMAILTTGL